MTGGPSACDISGKDNADIPVWLSGITARIRRKSQLDTPSYSGCMQLCVLPVPFLGGGLTMIWGIEDL